VQKLDLGLLVLRVVFGITMMCHGWNKISSGLNGTSNWFASIGMKWPKLQAPLAAYSELLAGALLALGLLTGVGTTLFIALMLIAIVTVHAKVGFFIFLPNGGWEYCASIIGVSVALSLTGPGKYSLDTFFDLPSNHSVWAIPCGVLVAMCHLAIAYRPQRTQ
jgi:putative oxidoreductase